MLQHDPNGRCKNRPCSYEVGGRWSCEHEDRGTQLIAGYEFKLGQDFSKILLPESKTPCATQPDNCEMKTIGLGECPSCRTFDCWLHYLRWEVRIGMTLNKAHHHLVTFPRSPLGATDRLGHDRDAAEAARANAERTDCAVANDSESTEVPRAATCRLCGALHGRWVKTHHKPGAKPGDKPCEGSWR